ncbi:hypothetical protein J6590_027075 [Homalodisca vitripennis]|nr:hypothetical protein J6590_027075 [Homalodisca vitripennis]
MKIILPNQRFLAQLALVHTSWFTTAAPISHGSQKLNISELLSCTTMNQIIPDRGALTLVGRAGVEGRTGPVPPQDHLISK